MKKIIIVLLTLGLLSAFAVWKFGPTINTSLSPQQITITYWGLNEEENLMRPLIAAYQKEHPNITINYVKQSSINYRTRVQNQMQEGKGPDVFRIHNSWTNMFFLRNDLAPSSDDIFTLNDYQSTFYPIATADFVRNDKIYAAPMEIDGLSMYYNEDILNGVGAKIPRSWKEFADAALLTTVKDQSGNIKTAGAALGTTNNIDHWQDILGLLLLQQPGVDLSSNTPVIATPKVAEVLSFFTSFAIDPRQKTWDRSMPSSTDAFVDGKLAFYFAPVWRVDEIRQKAPNLNFKIAPVPQLSGKNVGWASFWAEAVSAYSLHQRESWEFVKYLTSSEAQKMLNQGYVNANLIPKPYSRQDLAADASSDSFTAPFITQAQYYKSWFLASNTSDLGINDSMSRYWGEAINVTLQGQNQTTILQTLQSNVHQVLSDYNKAQVSAQQK